MALEKDILAGIDLAKLSKLASVTSADIVAGDDKVVQLLNELKKLLENIKKS